MISEVWAKYYSISLKVTVKQVKDKKDTTPFKFEKDKSVARPVILWVFGKLMLYMNRYSPSDLSTKKLASKTSFWAKRTRFVLSHFDTK